MDICAIFTKKIKALKKGNKIINGDEYHNKINNKLEGMEILLKHLNIGYEIKHENIFLPEEEMWEWQGEEKLKD